MFATATRNFVEEVDRGGSLVPVSSLNDTIALLSVVVKRRPQWFWQKPKHLPTDFTLNDLLTGDPPITPVSVETDFIKYNGIYGDNIQGSMEASLIHSNLNVEGKDSSKLQSSFGSLRKQEVDVKKLLQESKNRVLDMSHSLIQQTKEKNRKVFGIVKERIVTSQPCSVIEEVQQGGQWEGVLSMCGPKNPKISLKENGSLSKDSNVTMEIPTHTTLAYALIELEVKHDGRYNLCLMSDTTGGFEVDGPAEKRLFGVSGGPAHASENSCLTKELDQLKAHFQLLSSLPASTKSSLLQPVTKVMEDQTALSALQNVLDQMCLGNSPALGDVTMADAQKENIQTILDLLEESGERGSAQTEQSTSVLRSLHLITSALDEMPSDCLAAFRMCCSPAELDILLLLVQCVSGSRELPACNLQAFTDDVYVKAEHLFVSSNVSLKRDGDTVRTEINRQPGNLPLITCIAVTGLASLAQ
ncbi:gasdermin Eb [Aulostomus maculatus]